MPRKARSLATSKFIHVIVQGINQEKIFENTKDKNKYLLLLSKYLKDLNILILSYCIMDNHTHLLIYSQNIEKISIYMKHVNAIYAKYYNKKYDRVGYLFRNRFYSKSIMSENQLLQCIKYIHMNPVKAQIVKEEKDYKFSSYNDYIQKKNFINPNVLKIIFGSEKDYIKKLISIKYQELEKEKVNLESVVRIFLKSENIKIEQLRKDTKNIKRLINHLILNSYEFTQKELAMLIGISRSCLYRRLNNK